MEIHIFLAILSYKKFSSKIKTPLKIKKILKLHVVKFLEAKYVWNTNIELTIKKNPKATSITTINKIFISFAISRRFSSILNK